jgi:flagellum-specific peptidoglycan hydrolase FlgJ
VTADNNAGDAWARSAGRHNGRNRRRREKEPVQAVRKPWWQQATALVAVSTGGVITGFNFVPGASATMTSPTSVPVHLLALEQAARTGTDSGAGVTANTQLRSAIVNVAGYYLQLAQTKTAAQMEALIWDNTSSNGADHGESCAAFASLTLELAAQAVGQQSWVTGGSSYPWPLPGWADVRVDTNPASPAVTSLVADAQAHGRYHPVGDGYQPQPGDWVVFDSHVEVVTSYSDGVLHTIGADSLPGLTVNAHSFGGSLADDGVAAFVDNGNLTAGATGTATTGSATTGTATTGSATTGSAAASGTAAASAPGSGTATAVGSKGTAGTSKTAGTGSGTAGTGSVAVDAATGAAVPGLPAASDLLGGASAESTSGSGGASGSAAGGTAGSGAGSSAATVPGLPASGTATESSTSTASADVPGASGTPAATRAGKPAAAGSAGSASSKKPASTKAPASTKKTPSPSSAGRAYATPGTAQQQAFINLVAPGAVAAQQRYGVPAAVTIAQAIEESAWGGSGLAANYHNLFGIKGTGPAGSVSLPTSEYYNGEWVTIDAQFRVYYNDAQSIADHAELLATSGYYTRAMADRAVPDAFANDLTGVYATDPDYGGNLIALMKLYNLYRFDVPGTSSASAAPAAATGTVTDTGAAATTAARPAAGKTAPRPAPAGHGRTSLGRIPGVAAPALAPLLAASPTRAAAAAATTGVSRAATGRIPGLLAPGALAPGASTTAAVRYQTPLPNAVTTAFFANAKAPLARGEHLYRDVASCSGVSWKMLAAVDWMECKADPRRSPVHGEKLGSRNPDGTSYATKSQALAQCACDLIELAAAVYGIDLTARRQQSVRGLAAAFAAYRWGAILRRQGVSAMEFPYSVAGLTAQHHKMHWPDIDAPDAPDKPGGRFREPFGAVPVLLSLGYPAIV